MNKNNYLCIALFAYPLLALGISAILAADFLVSILLFLLIPCILLSLKANAICIKRSALFSLVCIPAIVVIDWVAQFSGQWRWASGTTLFPFRIFGVVQLEVAIWGFLFIYGTLLFYHCIAGRSQPQRVWTPKMSIFACVIIAFFLAFVSLFFNAPEFLSIPHLYFWFGMFMIVPPILVILFQKPKLHSKFLFFGSYFFYYNMVYEIAALQFGWWEFLSEGVVGPITLFGAALPVEELIFWCMLSSLAVISYYEFYDD